MKLFFSPGSCSLACHIALAESGLKFKTEKVDLKTKKVGDRDFLTVNPKGSVPVIETDDGEILTEAAVILQYIADQAPRSNLIPPTGSFERYRCQEWLNFVATELHKGFSPLWSSKTPEDYKIIVRENLERKLNFLSQTLGKSSYLMENFSVADAYLFTVLRWCAHLKFDLSRWPNVMGYEERVKNRPQVQKTLQTEGLLKS